MSQIDNTTLTAVFIAIIGVYAMINKFVLNNKPVSNADFEKHKENVQYKTNCAQIVMRMEASISAVAAVQNEKFKNIEAGLDRIERCIKDGN